MKLSATLLSGLASCLLPSFSRASLTSVYEFNETSGNTAADLIRGAPGAGTLNNFGGTQWVPGKIGNAVEFDGSNDFITALNVVPTGTTAFSVAAWVWADTAPVWGSIVKNWGGSSAGSFHFGFDNATGRISNYLNAPTDGPLIALGVLSLNAWHHVAVTYSGGSATQTLYIDGLQAAQRLTAPPDLDALGTIMGIGAKLSNAQTGADPAAPGFWDGKMDDLAFWNNVLTPAEIATVKANGDLGIGVAVPEPASAGFLILGALGFLRRRR